MPCGGDFQPQNDTYVSAACICGTLFEAFPKQSKNCRRITCLLRWWDSTTRIGWVDSHERNWSGKVHISRKMGWGNPYTEKLPQEAIRANQRLRAQGLSTGTSYGQKLHFTGKLCSVQIGSQGAYWRSDQWFPMTPVVLLTHLNWSFQHVLDFPSLWWKKQSLKTFIHHSGGRQDINTTL